MSVYHLDPNVVINLSRNQGVRVKEWNRKKRVITLCNAMTNSQHNVYYSSGCVTTILFPPTQGKIEIFRKPVSINELGVLLLNPEATTSNGTHQRAQQQWMERMAEDRIRKLTCWNCGGLGHGSRQCTSPQGITRHCYLCQGIGHMADNCANLKEPDEKLHSLACYTCGKLGHYSRECPVGIEVEETVGTNGATSHPQ